MYIRQALVLIFVILIAGCVSTNNTIKDNQTIHEVDGTKSELFDKTLYWFAQTFNDSKSVLEIKDKENGKVIGKGIKMVNLVVDYPMHFTIIVDLKDNKVRVTFSNIKIYNVPQTMDITWQFSEDNINEHLNSITSSLISYLNKKESSDSSW